ncbi:hypothetical protein VCHA53O466_140106 [Vibrio chagasii]|nr:hypothetical protein VCHA53O466_140106 [Vibrio chagasii]
MELLAKTIKSQHEQYGTANTSTVMQLVDATLDYQNKQSESDKTLDRES